MDEHIFKLIHSDELKESFRINMEFGEKTFNLTVLQKLKAWQVAVDQNKICSQAKQLELDVDEYYKKIKGYFTKTPENVNFRFSNNEFVINCNLENNMKVKYFVCNLKEVNYSNCVESLIEKYYSDRNNSLQRLTTLEQERYSFETEKNSLETKLNEFIERKNTHDQELYNNFVLVLNEKKKRIQHLNELLEVFRRGRPTVNPPLEVKKRITKSDVKSQIKTEVKNEISESESEDSYDTDEEKQRKCLSDVDLGNDTDKNICSDPIPSTSKCEYNLFCDDSPPRHILPKRIKTESSVNVNNISKHSTSQPNSEHSKDKKNNENITYKTTEESPNVDYSTQDLLDNISF